MAALRRHAPTPQDGREQKCAMLHLTFVNRENAAAVKYTEPHKRGICGAAQLSSAMSIDMAPGAQLSRAMSIDVAPGRSLVDGVS